MTSIPSAEKAPSLADLRKEFKRAYKMARITRMPGWSKAVARINLAIMAAIAKEARHG